MQGFPYLQKWRFNVKKKILSLLLVFMMCFSVFTGCALVERKDEKYYEAVVATITYQDNSTQEITKRELITAFNSYGYNYVQNYGQTTEQAVKTTIETIVEKYLTIKDVKDRYEAMGEELFDASEKSYLWDSTYDAVLSNLKSYLEGYEEPEGDSSSTNTDASVFTDYSSQIDSLVQDKNGNWVIKKKNTDTAIRGNYTVHSNEYGNFDFELEVDGEYPFQDLMFENIYAMTEEKAWSVAYNRYLEDIKDDYSYKNLKGDEWFKFKINRVYEILRDNYIVEKYEDLYNKANGDISNVTVTDVLKAYSQRVRVDYTNYVLEENFSSFESSVLTDIANVDYIVENKDNASVGNYFYVAPIKISVDGLSKLQTQRDNGEISNAQYNIEVQKLFDRNKELVSVRNAETGKVEDTISVNTLETYLQRDVKGSTENKVEQYRKYFYLYNDDDTYKNADYNAVFGVNASGTEAITPEGYEDEAIQEAILKLYNDGNAEIGDMSEIVQADDGFYVFFYAGKVQNLFDVTSSFDASSDQENIKILASTKLNVFSSKKLLDLLYDELASDNFSVFQNMDMNDLRDKTKSIEIHTENIKDLY